MKILGVAFDLEGPVVDVERAHFEGHILSAKELGVSLTIESALTSVLHFIGGPDEAVARDIWALSDKLVPEEEFCRQFLERDKFHYKLILNTTKIEPRPGLLDVLTELRILCLPFAIGSLTRTEEAMFLLEQSGLINHFQRGTIVLREAVKEVKPAPDVFLETARRMDIPPEHQLVFEDSPRGVTAAIRAGSRAIGIPVLNRYETVVPLLQAGAKRVFTDWREINIRALIQNLNNQHGAHA
ncbi:HAD family phosphatase [Candidatus Parcubacteria bacterium]|nr:MAG: HAD family phosphatase [Candidatus Parcubacteria bacterium]